jgi:hypothetical protein
LSTSVPDLILPTHLHPFCALHPHPPPSTPPPAQIRGELAEKELILLQKEQELLDKEQTLLVLKE